MRPRQLLLFFLSVGFLVAQPPDVTEPNSIRQEAKRRHGALVKEGYNLTYGFSWDTQKEKKPIRLDLLVPENQSEHQLSLWLETEGGEASIQLLNPSGEPLIRWAGHKGETVLSRRLATGKYTLEIDPSKTSVGHAEFGVKGPLMQICKWEPTTSRAVPASPSMGFHWPYLLFFPKEIKYPCLLVVPNNTGFAVEDADMLRASATCEIQKQSALAERLGCPLLVPMFPRPSTPSEEGNLYLHALSRASLQAQTKAWKRVDLQLLNMIQDAQSHLKSKGLKSNPRVLLSGFSASGSFVNRFAMLHPEHVLAVACGSPGGWPMAPVVEQEGERLSYPVGIADAEALTGSPVKLEALRSVHWLFYLGDQDSNDAVPYRDSFSRSDEELIFRRFGKTLPERWKQAERMYSSHGLPAHFALYPGVSHSVTPEIEADIALFFEHRLKATFGGGLAESKK